NRNIVTLPEAQHHMPAARVDADDAVREAAGVGDAVDDGRRAGDRPAGSDLPEDAPARGRDAVEHAVVRAEEHAPAPRRGRRVDVRAGVDTPEVAAGRRERGQRATR